MSATESATPSPSSENSLISSSKSSIAEVEMERKAVRLVLRVLGGGVFTTGLKIRLKHGQHESSQLPTDF